MNSWQVPCLVFIGLYSHYDECVVEWQLLIQKLILVLIVAIWAKAYFRSIFLVICVRQPKVFQKRPNSRYIWQQSFLNLTGINRNQSYVEKYFAKKPTLVKVLKVSIIAFLCYSSFLFTWFAPRRPFPLIAMCLLSRLLAGRYFNFFWGDD